MLYVFLVDTGVMMTFDMNIALESIMVLKKSIQARCGIPVDKQVLLINGGESLYNNKRVCQYSGTGTDTSPIYLFNKNYIENQVPPSIPLQVSPPQAQSHLSGSPLSGSPQLSALVVDANHSGPPNISSALIPPHVNLQQDELQLKCMRSKVSDAIQMQASYATITTRTEIARQLHELTLKQLSDCEQLIREQHLQHQGWQAVVANLEDISSAFVQSSDILIHNFTVFLTRRSQYKEVLNLLPNDLSILQEIPVLKFESTKNQSSNLYNGQIQDIKHKNDKLSASNPDVSTTEDKMVLKDTNVPSLEKLHQDTIVEPELSLLEWINSKDHHFTLQQMADSCDAVLEHLDGDQFVKLKDEIKHVRSLTENDDNKRIKKIEDRFFQLDETLTQAKKIVVEQSGLTKAFIQNQNSVQNHREQAILEDLCVSHCSQLKLMLENYEKLCAFKRRYLKAKNELICSLHSRLRVIMHIEKELSMINSKILIYSENLKKLKKQFEILSQVHMAPFVYFKTINELLRRSRFSFDFRMWADRMHQKCSQIYDKETRIRNDFKKLLSNHFLNSLFIGLDDEFPSFFNKLSPNFDSDLPTIKSSDIERLRKAVRVIKQRLNYSWKKALMNTSDGCVNINFDNCIMKLLDTELLNQTEKLLSNEPLACPVCAHKPVAKIDKSTASDGLPTIATGLSNEKVIKQKSTESAIEATEAMSDLTDLKYTDSAWKVREEQLIKTYVAEMNQMKEEYEQKTKSELNKLRNQLKSEHKLEMDTVRSRFKLACALERSSMESSLLVDNSTKSGSSGSSPNVNRDLTLKLHENLREKEIQIEQLKRSERNWRLALSRISSKMHQKNVDANEICAAVREVLESAKHQDKLSNSITF